MTEAHRATVTPLLDVLAQQPQDAVALETDQLCCSRQVLFDEVARFKAALVQRQVRALALIADNQPLWWVAALACRQLDITLVPIPAFFSAAQRAHVLTDAGVDTLVTPVEGHCFEPAFTTLEGHDRRPAGCALITYTSGTTYRAAGAGGLCPVLVELGIPVLQDGEQSSTWQK